MRLAVGFANVHSVHLSSSLHVLLCAIFQSVSDFFRLGLCSKRFPTRGSNYTASWLAQGESISILATLLK